MSRTRRLLPLVLVLAGGAGWMWIAPRLPRDQKVDLILGDRAPSVEDMTVRYVAGETAREVAFHWTRGAAPRTVHHEPRLPDGDYAVDIELAWAGGSSTLRRNVTLREGTITLIHAEDAREVHQ